MRFEWDEAKARRNLVLHGVDFIDAIKVFADPYRLENEDARHDYGERRFVTFGTVSDLVMAVVFTERPNSIRIISARRAEPNERKGYYQSHAGHQ